MIKFNPKITIRDAGGVLGFFAIEDVHDMFTIASYAYIPRGVVENLEERRQLSAWDCLPKAAKRAFKA